MSIGVVYGSWNVEVGSVGSGKEVSPFRIYTEADWLYRTKNAYTELIDYGLIADNCEAASDLISAGREFYVSGAAKSADVAVDYVFARARMFPAGQLQMTATEIAHSPAPSLDSARAFDNSIGVYAGANAGAPLSIGVKRTTVYGAGGALISDDLTHENLPVTVSDGGALIFSSFNSVPSVGSLSITVALSALQTVRDFDVNALMAFLRPDCGIVPPDPPTDNATARFIFPGGGDVPNGVTPIVTPADQSTRALHPLYNHTHALPQPAWDNLRNIK